MSMHLGQLVPVYIVCSVVSLNTVFHCVPFSTVYICSVREITFVFQNLKNPRTIL